jgi:ferric-dicitrate binding protein FerR (iron transport regulator)
MDKEKLSSLLKKYQQGIATEEETQLLFDWLDALDAAAEDIPTDFDAVKKDMISNIPVLNSKRRNYYIRIAAVIIPLIVATFIYWPHQQQTSQLTSKWETITNHSHHIQKIYLPDSSLVHLGAFSTIQYNNTRKVILLEGKAFFDVRTNPDLPFIVSDGSGVRTTVLGTSFLAEYTSTDKVSRISVATGKVSVHSGHLKTTLTPNQRVTHFNRSGVTGKDIISATDLLAWTNGETILHNANLQELISAIREHYGITTISKLNTNIGSYNLRIPSNLPLPALLEVVEKISYKPKVHFKLQHDQLSIE